MITDFRALCKELIDELQEYVDADLPVDGEALAKTELLVNRADTALAEQPVGPTDEELLRIYGVATPCYHIEEYKRELDFARAFLARWGTSNLAEVRSSLGDHQLLVEDDVDLYLEQ